MAKFASNSKVARKAPPGKVVVCNAAGGPGYLQSSKLEFVSILLTSFVQDQFYRSESGTILRVKELLKTVDPIFAAKAALFARNEFGMRSISHVVAAELAHAVKGQSWTKAFFDLVSRRADDPSEILAYYMATYGKPIPNSLKKGLGLALNRFSEYSLAKYRRDSSAFTLIDTVNLVTGSKPRPLKKDGSVWVDRGLSVGLGKLLRGELAAADTWENKLTKAGQNAENEENKAELKSAAWAELIREKKLGYLALIRNLRNILTGADAELIKLVCEQLVNRESIKKSLVFPFQINTAYEIVTALSTSHSRKLMAALDDAIDIACDNVPKLGGESVIFLDVSGSMESGNVAQIASIFAAVCAKAWSADVIKFSDSAAYVNYNAKDSTMSLARSFKFSSGGTNMPAAVQAMNRKYDRILILSDMQTWIGGNTNTTLHAYQRKFGIKPWVYSFDLAGAGTMAFPEDRVAAIAGFSDKIFKVMSLLEQDKNAMVNTIEEVTFVRPPKTEKSAEE
jgi:60 kDa SS-A/Ro ribonucleoprotein